MSGWARATEEEEALGSRIAARPSNMAAMIGRVESRAIPASISPISKYLSVTREIDVRWEVDVGANTTVTLLGWKVDCVLRSSRLVNVVCLVGGEATESERTCSSNVGRCRISCAKHRVSNDHAESLDGEC